MNKKAQIAEVLLFFLGVALAGMALYLMATFPDDLKSHSKELTEVTNEIEFNQQYVLEQTKLIAKESIGSVSTEQLEIKFKNNAAKREEIFRYQGAGNFYAKIRNYKTEAPTFTFIKQAMDYKLEIPNLFIQSERGANKIIRNFDLCMEFDFKGDFNKNCKISKDL